MSTANPSDGELKSLIVEAMNTLQELDDEQVSLYLDPVIMSEWNVDYPDLDAMALIELGVATCLSMRRGMDNE